MSFIETRFPEDIQFGFTGGPEFNTTVVTVGSGYEQRNRNWMEARCKWTAEHGPHGRAKTETLIAFFRSVAGKAHGFRFKDWGDYQVLEGQGTIILRPDGHLQLAKTYTTGGVTEYRPISKPVIGTVTLAGGGSLDYTTGIVTGGTLGSSWTGEFDVPVRFNTDKLELQITEGMNYVWSNIELLEIRV